jgi:NAD dependent epimerase/dehydratase family
LHSAARSGLRGRGFETPIRGRRADGFASSGNNGRARGGLFANDAFPADFLYDNLLIEANIIHALNGTGIEKLLFFGSSSIRP